ncbi:hypothetical protein [Aquimarina aggregata]|uniref:hypothetical protein n=1 Tax=Aquimarina aggregata TaxID=1642818 RepID=UPI00248F94CA|nr:hypothetical protein [Aquimarina aggregata]
MKGWLDTHKEKISRDSKKLFEEAILCYSIKAIRASLLFSYLGLLTIIKERIISAKEPEGLKEKRWENIIKELNDEDKWEKRVFGELINSSTPIFNISDSVREQIKYWKDRRNDCAHYKENEINLHHVEIFWSFIRSNLSKITIEGGKSSLLKKFAIHFDDTKTPSNADYTHLIKEIDTAIEISESDSFFQELLDILRKSFWYDYKKESYLFSQILSTIENIQIKSRLKIFIKSRNNKYDLKLIPFNTQLTNELDYSPQDIRQIWTTRLHVSDINGSTKYMVYYALLVNDLIPVNQLKEAMSIFYNTFDQNRFNNLVQDAQIKRVLANKQFLDVIYEEMFQDELFPISSKGYKDINSKADLIQLFLEYNELDTVIVGELVKLYQSNTNPQWLTDNLIHLFQTKPEIQSRFESICQSEGLRYPEILNNSF